MRQDYLLHLFIGSNIHVNFVILIIIPETTISI